MLGSSRPKWTEEYEPAGNERRSKSWRALHGFHPFSFVIYLTVLLLDAFFCFLAFFCQKGDDG